MKNKKCIHKLQILVDKETLLALRRYGKNIGVDKDSTTGRILLKKALKIN